MKRLLFISVIFFIINSCKTTGKTVVPSYKTEKVKELIASQKFSIECNRMYPTTTMALQSIANTGLIPHGNSVSQINITGNQNHFTVLKDSISVSLPYFGERRMSGGPYNNSNAGISFNGKPLEFTKDFNTKKNIQVFNIKFKSDNSEQYQSVINVYPEGNTDIFISSSHRTSIRFTGDLTVIDL